LHRWPACCCWGWRRTSLDLPGAVGEEDELGAGGDHCLAGHAVAVCGEDISRIEQGRVESLGRV